MGYQWISSIIHRYIYIYIDISYIKTYHTIEKIIRVVFFGGISSIYLIELKPSGVLGWDSAPFRILEPWQCFKDH